MEVALRALTYALANDMQLIRAIVSAPELSTRGCSISLAGDPLEEFLATYGAKSLTETVGRLEGTRRVLYLPNEECFRSTSRDWTGGYSDGARCCSR